MAKKETESRKRIRERGERQRGKNTKEKKKRNKKMEWMKINKEYL